MKNLCLTQLDLSQNTQIIYFPKLNGLLQYLMQARDKNGAKHQRCYQPIA